MPIRIVSCHGDFDTCGTAPMPGDLAGEHFDPDLRRPGVMRKRPGPDCDI